VIGAALDVGVERFLYVSSSMVFERATQFPTTEEHVWDVAMPRSAYGFSKLAGEVWVRASDDTCAHIDPNRVATDTPSRPWIQTIAASQQGGTP